MEHAMVSFEVMSGCMHDNFTDVGNIARFG